MIGIIIFITTFLMLAVGVAFLLECMDKKRQPKE